MPPEKSTTDTLQAAQPTSAAVGTDKDRSRSASASAAQRRGPAWVWTARVAIVVVVLSSWELSANYLMTRMQVEIFYSKPSLILHRITGWFTTGTSMGSIWEQILVTLEEAVGGFVFGSIAGVLLGILLGRSQFLAEVCSPFIKAANAVPRIVLASLFTIWFGFGVDAKISTALVLVFFPVFFNAFQGAREVDRNLVNNARILGASRSQVLLSIVFPSATSWILTSLHSAFGFALIGAIVAEYAGASQGLGLLIAKSQNGFDPAGIFGGMILITVIALLAAWLLGLLENRLLRWRPPSLSVDVAA